MTYPSFSAEPTVFPQAVAIAVATASSSWGRTPEEICADLQIDPAVLTDPERRLPHSQVMRAWAGLAEADDDFGLNVARLVGRAEQSLVEYAVVNASTLGNALLTFARLAHLVHDAAAHRLEILGGEGVFRLALSPPLTAPNSVWDFLAATLVVRMRAATGGEIDPSRVTLPRRAFQDDSLARAVFQAPIHYGAAPAVHWPRAVLDCPLQAHDPRLHALLTRRLDGAPVASGPQATSLLPQNHDVLVELRRELRLGVLRGEASLETLARRVGVSRRSLQRKLAERGTTYQAELDDARRAVALSLLAEHGSSVKQAAFTVGFSRVAAFSRAFRRWTGRSPSAHLAQMRSLPR